LRGCVNDAASLSALLARNEDGSPNFDCKLITAPSDLITRSSLKESIARLFEHEADVALFYFSGHGTENNLGGYLVTPDAKHYDEGVPMQDVLAMANRAAKIGEVAILLDCCHSGALGQVPAIANGNAVLREGISVLTASRAGQVAIEIHGGGLFTGLVRGALSGGASDVLGKVTIASVYAYVDQALGSWDQRPLFKAHLSRLISLRSCRPGVPSETLRLLPKYFVTSDAEFKLDSSYEPDAEPAHAEHEAIFGHLQKFRAARLLVPVGEEHMYFAAIKGKSCRLTPLGEFYWRLANAGRL
jgi:hypothetical protein